MPPRRVTDARADKPAVASRVHVSSATTRDLRDLPDAEIPRWRGQPGQQKPVCGFAVATLMVLCDAAGFIVRTLALPLGTHDGSQIARARRFLSAIRPRMIDL